MTVSYTHLGVAHRRHDDHVADQHKGRHVNRVAESRVIALGRQDLLEAVQIDGIRQREIAQGALLIRLERRHQSDVQRHHNQQQSGDQAVSYTHLMVLYYRYCER